MAASFPKQIAGVRLVQQPDGGVMLTECPSYGKWIHQRGEEASEKIEIRIRAGLDAVPHLEAGSRIFESGEAWSMYRRGEDYWAMLKVSAFPQPLWVVCIDGGFRHVTVHCGEDLIKRVHGQCVIQTPVRYPLDQILLMYFLAQRKGALLHAAGLDFRGQGYILPGKSGAGKTTAARQFVARGQAGLLSDDRMAVRKIGGVFRAFGTPWPGEAGIAENRNVPLKGIFFISHGSKNTVKDIEPRQAFERLLPVTSVPWYDAEVVPRILAFCEDLAFTVPAYEFYFTPTIEAADTFEAFVAKS